MTPYYSFEWDDFQWALPASWRPSTRAVSLQEQYESPPIRPSMRRGPTVSDFAILVPKN